MGAGQFPAGGFPGGPFERAGVDPVWVGAPSPPPKQFRSIKFDLGTRTFPFNADGTAYDVHPVDQRVAILLWVPQGSLGSSPGIGTRIKARIARVDPRSIPTIVRDEVRNVLQPLIAAGDITLLRIDVDASVPGRAAWAVYYKNLRDTSDNSTGNQPVRGQV